VFTADRGHLHHSLLLRGWTVGQTAALAAGLTAITCGGAVISFLTGQEAYALAASAGVVLALAAARIFGHAELALLNSHVRSLTRRVVYCVRPNTSEISANAGQAIQLQGNRQWNVLWTALREAGESYKLGSLKLNVNIPHLHVSFYGSWKASDVAGSDDAWRIVMPLTYGSRSIGRLLIAGREGGNKLAEMQQMLDFLEPLEAEMARLVEAAEADLAVNGSSTRLGAPRRRIDAEPVAAATEFHTDYY
jgi:UDP-GlcNAc:undecaprenyl-phosphate GlcNAc-1-phosphate transferase